MSNSNYDITSNTLVPSNAGSTVTSASEWGISETLSGYIIQSESLTSELVTDQTQDQQGRIVSELDYDKHWTCTLNVIGTSPNTETYEGSIIDFKPQGFTASKKWKVRSVQFDGSYNDKKKYTITLERWNNFPSAQ